MLLVTVTKHFWLISVISGMIGRSTSPRHILYHCMSEDLCNFSHCTSHDCKVLCRDSCHFDTSVICSLHCIVSCVFLHYRPQAGEALTWYCGDHTFCKHGTGSVVLQSIFYHLFSIDAVYPSYNCGFHKQITVFFSVVRTPCCAAVRTENCWYGIDGLMLIVVRSTVAGSDVYAGQQVAASDMYSGQPAMSMASYQGYVISKDTVNAAAAAPVPPISSMWHLGHCRMFTVQNNTEMHSVCCNLWTP